MWKLECEESWGLKNWCFWTVVLEKTLESPLDCKKIQPVHPKGNQSWVFIGRTDLKLKLQYFGHLMQRTDSLEKSPDAGKDWRREKKGTAKDEMVGWHHRLSGHEFEQAPVDDERWESQAFFSPWGCKKLDMTEWLNNNKKCKEEIANHCPRAINHSKHSDISLSHFPCVYWVFRCALVNACMYTCVQVCDLDESSFAIFCSVSVLHFHCEPLPISLNSNFCCLVVRSCLNLWDPMDSILPGSKDTGVGLSFPSLGDLPDPGIKPGSPTLAGEFFTTEPLGKPR